MPVRIQKWCENAHFLQMDCVNGVLTQILLLQLMPPILVKEGEVALKEGVGELWSLEPSPLILHPSRSAESLAFSVGL